MPDGYIKDLITTALSIVAFAWDAHKLRKAQRKLQKANDKFLSFATLSSAIEDTTDSIYDVVLEDDQQNSRDVWARSSVAKNMSLPSFVSSSHSLHP
jgi:hypothetical protein